MPSPPESSHLSARFCWLAFGTMARGEVLRLAPPKIGVVYDDENMGDTTAASVYFNAVTARWALGSMRAASRVALRNGPRALIPACL